MQMLQSIEAPLETGEEVAAARVAKPKAGRSWRSFIVVGRGVCRAE